MKILCRLGRHGLFWEYVDFIRLTKSSGRVRKIATARQCRGCGASQRREVDVLTHRLGRWVSISQI